SKQLRDIRRDRLLREPERRKRAVDVLAPDQIEHESGLLRRRAHVAGGGVGLNHDDFSAGFGAAPAPAPAPAGAPGPPGPAAAAAAAALSATRVVCPLNWRVGANSPSL